MEAFRQFYQGNQTHQFSFPGNCLHTQQLYHLIGGDEQDGIPSSQKVFLPYFPHNCLDSNKVNSIRDLRKAPFPCLEDIQFRKQKKNIDLNMITNKSSLVRVLGKKIRRLSTEATYAKEKLRCDNRWVDEDL